MAIAHGGGLAADRELHCAAKAAACISTHEHSFALIGMLGVWPRVRAASWRERCGFLPETRLGRGALAPPCRGRRAVHLLERAVERRFRFVAVLAGKRGNGLPVVLERGGGEPQAPALEVLHRR